MVETQKNKLKTLNNNQINSSLVTSLSNFKVSDTVINVSSTPLSMIQLEALSFGFHMSWPTKVSDEEIHEAGKAFIHSWRSSTLQTQSNLDAYSSELSHILRRYSQHNVSVPHAVNNYMSELKSLRRNNDLIINRWDKGSGICIDSKSNYVEKLNLILSDNNKFDKFVPHGNSKQHPIVIEEVKVNRMLRSMKNEKL